jgi:hypothetical protein
MGISARSASDANLDELVDLFHRAYAGYAGFAERSVEDFRWRYLDRPDIGNEGVIVVEDAQQRAIGYIVVGTSGTIWEYAIDPDSNRREVASLLITEAERRMIDRDVDEIVLHAPVEDQDMAAALHTDGYGRGSPIQQYLSFIDLPGVVEQVLMKHRDALPVGLGSVEFIIRNPRAWHPKRFAVSATGTRSAASQDRPLSLSISASVETLVAMMVGSVGPGRAVASGVARIAPVSKTAVGLKVLRALRLRDPFFFTAGDVI